MLHIAFHGLNKYQIPTSHQSVLNNQPSSHIYLFKTKILNIKIKKNKINKKI